MKNIAVENIQPDREEEMNQLRTELATITTQCSQLNEANQAWQLYQQTQLHQFINQLQDYLSNNIINKTYSLVDVDRDRHLDSQVVLS